MRSQSSHIFRGVLSSVLRVFVVLSFKEFVWNWSRCDGWFDEVKWDCFHFLLGKVHKKAPKNGALIHVLRNFGHRLTLNDYFLNDYCVARTF